MSLKKIGLFAGEGRLPAQLIQEAKSQGYEVIVFALSPQIKENLQAIADKTYEITPGQLGKNIDLVQRNGIKEVVFIGKVPKLDLLKNLYKLDWTAIREMSKLVNFNDDTIQQAVARLVEANGASVISQTKFLQNLFPDIGVLTSKQPSDDDLADINYGYSLAKELARLDIGQSIVVKNLMIIAIEAIEGTDEAIKRAVSLCNKPIVVVKVAKEGHDTRFDVPTVGMNTLKAINSKNLGGVLAISHKETMILEKDEMVEYANQNNMSIVVI